MINMFSLVHGRANFIPQAKSIDHVNVKRGFFLRGVSIKK